MPPTVINFNEAVIQRVGKCRVFVRDRWFDEWEEVEHLYATEIVWSCQPTMPTATLRWDYGRILRPGSAGFEDVAKLDWSWPKYCKIVVECQLTDEDLDLWTERTWYGVLQIAVDQTDGIVRTGDEEDPKPRMTGRQTVIGYGLEHLLSVAPIISTGFRALGEDYTRYGLRETFNRDGLKNSTAADTASGHRLFQDVPDDGAYWNTKEIVRYLLGEAIPEDAFALQRITFRVRAGCYLPDWDRPELPQENATVLSLLNQILHRGRLLNWWFEVVENDVPETGEDVVELVTQTILKADLPTDLPGNHVIPASTRQIHLQYDEDTETRAVVKDSGLPVCDQVIVRGRPLQYVCTVGFTDDTAQFPNDWKNDWTSEEEEAYRTAASGDPNYATLTLVDAQRANAVARSRVALEDVFSRFAIPSTWDRKDHEEAQVFAEYPGNRGQSGDTPWSSWRILSHLPLYYGYDYPEYGFRLTDPDLADDLEGSEAEPQNDREYLPILLFFNRPEDGAVAYVMGQEMGRLAEFGVDSADDIPACTAAASVGKDSRSLRIRVSGKPQHIIAGSSFTKLDVDEVGGVYNWELMKATVALENGLHIEHRFPERVQSNADVLRVHEVRAADHYEMVYVSGSTVVDIKTGVAADSYNLADFGGGGGWIQRPANGMKQLAALAKIAYSWYSEPHRVVSLETTRLRGDAGTDAIKLGDLLVRVGDDMADNTHAVDCVSPITEIRISWPVHDGAGSPPAPTMSVTTSAGELDPLNIQAPPPQDARGVERRAFDRRTPVDDLFG